MDQLLHNMHFRKVKLIAGLVEIWAVDDDLLDGVGCVAC